MSSNSNHTPRTVEHRYHSAKLCYGTPGDVHEWQTYTYESGTALYDVIDAEGRWVYRVNLQTVAEPTAHHLAIAEHFGLWREDR